MQVDLYDGHKMGCFFFHLFQKWINRWHMFLYGLNALPVTQSLPLTNSRPKGFCCSLLAHQCHFQYANSIVMNSGYFSCSLSCDFPSVLWCCWLGGRNGIRPVKKLSGGCWRGYLPGARCRLALSQLIPLPLTVSCFSKIQIGFSFLVPAHPGSPGKMVVKRVCVCVCALRN